MLDFASSTPRDLFSYSSWRSLLDEPPVDCDFRNNITEVTIDKVCPQPYRVYARVGRRFMDHASFSSIAWRIVSWRVRRSFFTPDTVTLMLLRVEAVMSRLHESTGSKDERRSAIEAIMAGPDLVRSAKDSDGRCSAGIYGQANAVSDAPALARGDATPASQPQPQPDTQSSTAADAPAALPARVNPLKALRQAQRRGAVDVAAIERGRAAQAARPARAKAVKPVPAIGVVESAGEKVFVDDDGVVIDLRRMGSNLADGIGFGYARTAAGDIDRRAVGQAERARREEDEPRQRVTLSSGVGAVFSSDLWPVDVTDVTALPRHGMCRNPDIACDTPAVNGSSYCPSCRERFIATPKTSNLSPAARAKIRAASFKRWHGENNIPALVAAE